MATIEQDTGISQGTIEGIGAIEGPISFPYPEHGGVVVFRADHGAGKSTALDAIAKLAGANIDLEVNDNCTKGSISAFGLTLTIGRSTRRKGEAEVSMLSGRFSIADLVDPGLKTEDLNDARRIKALVQLAGVSADISLFYSLVGSKEDFDAIVPPSSATATDLVAMTEVVKRDLERAARTAEGQHEHATGKAKAFRDQAGEIDLKTETDAKTLQGRYESAVRTHEKLKADAAAATQAELLAKDARELIATATGNYSGRTPQQASAYLAKCCGAHDAMLADIQRIKSELALLETELTALSEHVEMAKRSKREADEHEASMARWRQSIDAGLKLVAPNPADVMDASIAVESARRAVETGALVRAALSRMLQADEAEAEAKAHAERAERLRAAAQGTDTVLSDAVGRTGTSLRVVAGRLVTKTDRSDRELYSDLSDGERWETAVGIAINAVGTHGVFDLPQWAWEGFNGQMRRKIAKQLRAAKVVAYTAEVTDDDGLSVAEYSEAAS